MPAGVTWAQYLRFSAAAMASMIAGAQLVHIYYRPLEDLENYIRKELNTLPGEVQKRIVKELEEEHVLEERISSGSPNRIVNCNE